MQSLIDSVCFADSYAPPQTPSRRQTKTSANKSLQLSRRFISAFSVSGLALLEKHTKLTCATERNGRKTLTTVQGVPKKFDQKKILKVIKKKFACNGTIVADAELGEVIQLQGDQRKDVQEFLTDKKEGLGLDVKTVQVHGF